MKRHPLELVEDDFNEMLERFRGHVAVYARLAASLHNERWRLDHADIVVGEPPHGWLAESWSYPEVCFVARRVSMSSLRRLLSSTQSAEETIRLAGRDVRVPAVLPQLPQIERRPSRRGAIDPDLGLPHMDTRFSAAEPLARNYSGRLLVSRDAPPFINEDLAWAAFFERRHGGQSQGRPNSDLVRLRWVDKRAIFLRISQDASGLDLLVGGTQVAGCHVDVHAEGFRWRGKVVDGEPLRVPVPGGVPHDCLLVLAYGDQWMDYRVLNQRFPSVSAESDVVILDPLEPADELREYVLQGEGPALEFKRQIPADDRERQRIARTAAAFANGAGGTIVFGIEPDEVTLSGIESTQPDKLRDTVQRILTERVTPPPIVEVKALEVGGRFFVVAQVGAGGNPPYAANPQSPTYYVRRGASTVHAHPTELRALIAARMPNMSASPFGL